MEPESQASVLPQGKRFMPNLRSLRASFLGCGGPVLGSNALAVLAFAAASTGCGTEDETRILPPEQVAMDASAPAVFNDGETVLFEVKRPVYFPIIAPEGGMPDAQDGVAEPYGRTPWITLEDVRVQLTWTLSNLENRRHNVWLLVDPRTEFGRYWPGLTLVDAEEGEYVPNRSGYEYYYSLEGKGAGEKSRRHGTLTYDDMDEVARDFATVMNMIKFPPTTGIGGGELAEGESALPTFVNHTFHFENRSEDDPLVAPWVPGVVAGLTGVDIGLRTADSSETAGPDQMRVAPKLALEVVVEITDLGSGKLRREGANDLLLESNETIITAGVAAQ
jgi:hypothetical protein